MKVRVRDRDDTRALDDELERLERALGAAASERRMLEAGQAYADSAPDTRPGERRRTEYVVSAARRREELLELALSACRTERAARRGTAS